MTNAFGIGVHDHCVLDLARARGNECARAFQLNDADAAGVDRCQRLDKAQAWASSRYRAALQASRIVAQGAFENADPLRPSIGSSQSRASVAAAGAGRVGIGPRIIALRFVPKTPGVDCRAEAIALAAKFDPGRKSMRRA